jgi:hypothetical protein
MTGVLLRRRLSIATHISRKNIERHRIKAVIYKPMGEA